MRIRLSSVWDALAVGARPQAVVVGAVVLLAALIGVAHFSAKADGTQAPGASPKPGAPVP